MPCLTLQTLRYSSLFVVLKYLAIIPSKIAVKHATIM